MHSVPQLDQTVEVKLRAAQDLLDFRSVRSVHSVLAIGEVDSSVGKERYDDLGTRRAAHEAVHVPRFVILWIDQEHDPARIESAHRPPIIPERAWVSFIPDFRPQPDHLLTDTSERAVSAFGTLRTIIPGRGIGHYMTPSKLPANSARRLPTGVFMRLTQILALSSVALAASLAACGGGGGGSSGGGLPPTPTPTPTATPITTAAVAGRVTDCQWPTAPSTTVLSCTAGVAIAGATVIIGPTLVTGATPPPTVPAGDVSTTTAADGTYAFANAPSTGNVYVSVHPASGDAHVSLHAQLGMSFNSGTPPNPVPAIGRTTTLTFSLATPAPEEAAWLNSPCGGPNPYWTQRGQNIPICGMNADRGNAGVAALIFDEYALEVARNWSNIVATTPWINDPPNTTVPATNAANSPAALYAYRGGNFAQQGRVIFAPGPITNATYLDGEAGFESEETSPPGPHWAAIVNASYGWVGLARFPCSTSCPNQGYEYIGLLFQAQ